MGENRSGMVRQGMEDEMAKRVRTKIVSVEFEVRTGTDEERVIRTLGQISQHKGRYGRDGSLDDTFQVILEMTRRGLEHRGWCPIFQDCPHQLHRNLHLLDNWKPDKSDKPKRMIRIEIEEVK